MRITWVTRSFLDYRIPIYKKLSELNNDEFYLIYCDEEHVNPKRVRDKIKLVLGDRAIGMKGEICLGEPYKSGQISNKHFRIFFQPKLISNIKMTRPDVIITDAFNHWTLPVFFLKICGYKFKHIVCYERTLHTERNAKKLKLKFIRYAQRWIDYIHVNGSLCKEFLLYLGYPLYKIKNGNMSADTTGLEEQFKKIKENEIINLKDKLNLCETVYLFIGRLIELKGVKQLLNAWSKANLKDASLLIIGDGPQKDELNNIIVCNCLNNIKMLGAIDYNNIGLYYRISDCFIMPTLDDNWSLVIPEAMSCRLPIISSIYNGCWPELVKKENGWTFDPLSEESFINVLNESFRNRNSFDIMGKKSYEIVQDFTAEKNANRIYNTCKL